VGLDRFHLIVRESADLVQKFDGESYLAEIVQRRCQTQFRKLWIRHPHETPDIAGVTTHAVEVLRNSRVMRFAGQS
jgi:hypothetical protein